MKWVLLCGMPAIVGGGFYFHGPLSVGEVYARPASEVAYTLETMTLPDMVGETMQSLPSGNSTRVTVPGKSVTYYFQARGAQTAKFVAEIEAVDDTHTRVSTHMVMADDAETLMKSPIMPIAKVFEKVGAVAMREQIDARLEERPFDKTMTQRAMASFAVANIGAIQRSVAESINERSKMEQNDGFDRTDRDVRFVPGQPMVETDPRRR